MNQSILLTGATGVVGVAVWRCARDSRPAVAAPASQCGIRVVHLRLSIVLAPHGGALAKMLCRFSGPGPAGGSGNARRGLQ